MSMPTQVSAVKGVRKSKNPVSSEMSFLSRMLMPVCMNGLLIPTTFSRAAVRVSGAIARSASCRGWIDTHFKIITFLIAPTTGLLLLARHNHSFLNASIVSHRCQLGNSSLCRVVSKNVSFSCTHASHHLSNHPIPVPVLILSAVWTILHQLHFVFEAQFLGYFRQQVHAEALHLGAFGHCIWLLLSENISEDNQWNVFNINCCTIGSK